MWPNFEVKYNKDACYAGKLIAFMDRENAFEASFSS